MNIDVHELKPGTLGLIAHCMKPNEWNAYIKEPNPGKTPWIFVDNVPYKLSLHIPHSSLVLVVKAFSASTVQPPIQSYYEVIWQDFTCLVQRDLIINPRANDIQES